MFSGWWLGHPSEKYEFVNWDDEIPNIWENRKCSKPPTSNGVQSIVLYLMAILWFFMKHLGIFMDAYWISWEFCEAQHIMGSLPGNSNAINLQSDWEWFVGDFHGMSWGYPQSWLIPSRNGWLRVARKMWGTPPPIFGGMGCGIFDQTFNSTPGMPVYVYICDKSNPTLLKRMKRRAKPITLLDLNKPWGEMINW